MEKVKGVSEFGRMESGYKKILDEAQELDNIVNFISSRKTI